MAREAAENGRRIEAASSERRADDARSQAQLDKELEQLYEARRQLRREVYDAHPGLEGQPVRRGVPGGRP